MTGILQLSLVTCVVLSDASTVRAGGVLSCLGFSDIPLICNVMLLCHQVLPVYVQYTTFRRLARGLQLAIRANHDRFLCCACCSLPAKGSEQLSITFPFVAYGPKHQYKMLGMLPQSHTCTNTLELPNYAEAVIATEPQLAEEWSEANVPRTHRTSSSHQMKGMEGLSRLVARCCAVLEDRLLVSHVKTGNSLHLRCTATESMK